MSGVCSVLAWVALLRGRHISVVGVGGVGGVGDVLACVAWVGGWCVCVDGVLAWVV